MWLLGLWLDHCREQSGSLRESCALPTPGQIDTEHSGKHPLLTRGQHRHPSTWAYSTPVRLPADDCSLCHWCSVCVAGACDLCQWQPFRPSHSSRWTDSLPWPRQQFLRVPWSCSWGGGLWAETHHWQGLPHHCRGTGESWRVLSSVLYLVS